MEKTHELRPSYKAAAPYLIIFTATLGLWVAAISLERRSLLDHNGADQHTLQAQSWLRGHIDIPDASDSLEVAKFEGRKFNSFPPTPTIFEFPWVFFFGTATPSYLLLYLFAFAASIALYEIGIDRGISSPTALVLALIWCFGSNVFTSLAAGGVWYQGQVYGFAFAVLGLRWIRNRPALAYFALALAVGCRPFYLFYLPLWVALGATWGGRRFSSAIKPFIYGFCPYVLFLAGYNWIRFKSPFEFGHKYLPWSSQLQDGIFSFAYLPRNLFHTFAHLPSFSSTSPIFDFDGRGTAFWLNNPIAALGLFGLLFGKIEKPLRLAALFSLALVWSGLLLHESNGWYQFGLRYIIDVMPIFVLGVCALFRGAEGMPALTALALYSFAVNFYGIWWFTR